MRRATIVTIVGILVALSAVAAVGLSTGGHTLDERWISDTPRDNRVNHHPVTVAEPGVIVAPVAAVGGAGPYDSTSCALVRLAPADGTVEWRHGIAPANCTSHAITGPAIADVDIDGEREIAIATTERALEVLQATDGEAAWQVPLETYGYAPPVIADLLGDSTPEVIVVDIGGSVSLVADRSVRWERDLDGSTWAVPIVTDVDSDGQPEIVVGTNDAVVALDTPGDRVWTADAAGADTGFAPSHDGPPLVLAADTGRIAAIDGRTGDTVWNYTGSWTPVVGDVRTTSSGQTVFAALSGGRLVALDARIRRERVYLPGLDVLEHGRSVFGRSHEERSLGSVRLPGLIGVCHCDRIDARRTCGFRHPKSRCAAATSPAPASGTTHESAAGIAYRPTITGAKRPLGAGRVTVSPSMTNVSGIDATRPRYSESRKQKPAAASAASWRPDESTFLRRRRATSRTGATAGRMTSRPMTT